MDSTNQKLAENYPSGTWNACVALRHRSCWIFNFLLPEQLAHNLLNIQLFVASRYRRTFVRWQTRIALSILMSCLIYDHPITELGLLGMLLVFGAVFYRINRRMEGKKLLVWEGMENSIGQQMFHEWHEHLDLWLWWEEYIRIETTCCGARSLLVQHLEDNLGRSLHCSPQYVHGGEHAFVFHCSCRRIPSSLVIGWWCVASQYDDVQRWNETPKKISSRGNLYLKLRTSMFSLCEWLEVMPCRRVLSRI